MEPLPTILPPNASGVQRRERRIEGWETNRIVERTPEINHRCVCLIARVCGAFISESTDEGDRALGGRIDERAEGCDSPRVIRACVPFESLLRAIVPRLMSRL